MGSTISFVRARRRFYTYGSDYFNHAILPKCQNLIKEIEISHSDAAKLFDAFVKMDTDGSGSISVSEFHRYFGWKRGVFTERIFDTYSALAKSDDDHPTKTREEQEKDDNELSYEEFLICVWNYATYDANLMARYLFDIFDIDGTETLSTGECNAMFRMVHYNQPKKSSCDDAMHALLDVCEGSSAVTLQSFVDLVITDNSIIQPAFDVQSRIIKKTTGDMKSFDDKCCWELYRERRREKFGTSNSLPDVHCDGKSISSASARFASSSTNDEGAARELSEEFLSSLFLRVERHLEAPDGFDSRLEEERYVDKLREALSAVEKTLSSEDFIIDRVEERKELRKRLWSLVDEIRVSHVDALYAELERDLDIWDRTTTSPDGVVSAATATVDDDDDGSNPNRLLGYSSEDEMRESYDILVDAFNDKWSQFVDSYEDRFGPVTTHWEKMYDADQNLTFYFQWQTGERCYDQQVGNAPPAICEVCDCLVELTDYKCFNCDAPRSERNKKKYRGRVSLEDVYASKPILE